MICQRDAGSVFDLCFFRAGKAVYERGLSRVRDAHDHRADGASAHAFGFVFFYLVGYGLPDLRQKILYPVSVNLSRDRLYDTNLVQRLTDIVDSYGVYHDLIDFELTESASYDNTEQMIHVLNELRDKGFHISMDDFGTGYSSFSLLTQMPLDTLKIDKSFVDKVGVDNEMKEDFFVIMHIISLAKKLGFICLAEGAENKSQIDELRALGCDVIQGYYYSKPISIEEYENKYLN